ncbi:MAG: glycosyltransferase family 39 protein [Pseudolabrys sp.]|nr:glycosyltransferase family 39 protein [Pseudolabrys sp.]
MCIFAVLAAAILTRSAKWMGDFDQSFYLTIAYDLDRYGVYSNGMFDDVNSVDTAPKPGMFIAPVYPLLVLAATKLDPRFAAAAWCSVEANHQRRDRASCETYTRPMHLIHALLLTLGVLAIARSTELIFGGVTFWLAGALATLALLPGDELFSFVMTESITFSLFSLTMLALLKSWKTPRWQNFAIAGLLLGLLCLTRTAFIVLAPVMAVLILINGRIALRRWAFQGAAAFALCFVITIVPWAIRNSISVGKFGMTEEYGSAALVERFAFNSMTPAEFALAFPYCLPEIGRCLISSTVGTQATDRFEWYQPNSFFNTGRALRTELIATHKKLDPVIGDILRAEMKDNWWRHILVSIPLAWCGMWVGGWLGLFLVPAFLCAGVAAIRRREPLFLLYAVPALTMLALHAGLANHYTRYNLILIGPFAAGAAWLIVTLTGHDGLISRARSRWRATAPMS